MCSIRPRFVSLQHNHAHTTTPAPTLRAAPSIWSGGDTRASVRCHRRKWESNLSGLLLAATATRMPCVNRYLGQRYVLVNMLTAEHENLFLLMSWEETIGGKGWRRPLEALNFIQTSSPSTRTPDKLESRVPHTPPRPPPLHNVTLHLAPSRLCHPFHLFFSGLSLCASINIWGGPGGGAESRDIDCVEAAPYCSPLLYKEAHLFPSLLYSMCNFIFPLLTIMENGGPIPRPTSQGRLTIMPSSQQNWRSPLLIQHACMD